MARKSTATKVVVQQVNDINEGEVARLTASMLELSRDSIKQQLVTESEKHSLNEDQLRTICNLVDSVTEKSKDTAFRQVISLFK